MKTKILLIALLLFSFLPPAAHACPTGNPKTLAYVRRDDNRCEGLQDYRPSSGVFDLISFSTSNLKSYPNQISIRVPGTKAPPTVEIVSFIKNYHLDEVETRFSSLGFVFSLDTTVLKRANVPLSSLRAIAYINRDSSFVYFPTILGQSSRQYVFVVDSPQPTTFPIFEIRRDGKPVLKKPIKSPREGQIRFTWEYRNAPAGSYELYIVNGQGQPRTFRFEHNPKWL